MKGEELVHFTRRTDLNSRFLETESITYDNQTHMPHGTRNCMILGLTQLIVTCNMKAGAQCKTGVPLQRPT